MWADYKQILTITKDSTCVEISVLEQKIFINSVLYPCSSSVESDGVLWVNESNFISDLFKYGIKFNCREIWWEDRSTIEFEAFYREKGYFPTRLIEYNNSDDSFSVNTNRHLSKKTLERWSAGVANPENYEERIFYRFNIEGIAGYIVLEKDDSDNYISSKWVELEITSPSYYTDRFIHVGDSKELVAKIYGSPDNYSDDEWQASIVPAEGGGIKFIFDKLPKVPYL